MGLAYRSAKELYKFQENYFFIFETMKLNVSNSSLFTRKLKGVTDADKQKLEKHVSKLASSFQNGKDFFNKNTFQPYSFQLKNNLESSLYSSKVSNDVHVILTIDEDPLFHKLDVTLLDITTKDKEEMSFKKIGEQIYRSENLL